MLGPEAIDQASRAELGEAMAVRAVEPHHGRGFVAELIGTLDMPVVYRCGQ
jgi:hypothetical protein